MPAVRAKWPKRRSRPTQELAYSPGGVRGCLRWRRGRRRGRGVDAAGGEDDGSGLGEAFGDVGGGRGCSWPRSLRGRRWCRTSGRRGRGRWGPREGGDGGGVEEVAPNGLDAVLLEVGESGGGEAGDGDDASGGVS